MSPPVLTRVSSGQGFSSVATYKRAYIARSAGGGTYQISRSLRFNSSDSAALSRTFSTAGDRRTWTLSWWMKLGKLGTERGLFGMPGTSSGAPQFYSRIGTDDQLYIYDYVSGANYQLVKQPSAKLRDTSAWYHCMFVYDSTQSVAEDGFKIYLNGTRLTTWTINTLSGYVQNYQGPWNSTQNTGVHIIGQADAYFDGYMADIWFVGGSALTPSDFAETNATTGQWVPKAYTGSTSGTNTFHLEFADNSGTTSTTLGKDTSGNSNNFTPSGFSVGTYTKFGYPSDLSAAGGLRTEEPASYAFDGSLSTGAATVGDAQVITWSPSNTVTATTSLQILMQDYAGGAATVNSISMSQGAAGPNGNDHYYNYTGSFPITITSLTSKSNSQASRLYAILVDGSHVVSAGVNGENDSLVDTPTSYGTDTGVGAQVRGNYCTFNPLDRTTNAGTLTNGNLNLAQVSAGAGSIRGTIGVSSGKWYFEVTPTTAAAGTDIGVVTVDSILPANWLGTSATAYTYYQEGTKTNNNTRTSYGDSWTSNDVIGVALDLDNGKIFFAKNNTWQNSGSPTAGTNPAFSGLSGTFTVGVGDGNGANGSTFVLNCGQRAFAYTAPSGFKALCDTNLTAPTIAKSNTVMDVLLYSANGSTQTISGLNFSPDLVWSKSRNRAYPHGLHDSVRGAYKYLRSNGTNAETDTSGDSATYTLTSFNSDGFSVGADGGAGVINNNAAGATTYVAWCWDAGTSTVTNTQGSITSSVRANASAGISIVGYTGTGTAGTVGHGLGVTPGMVIVKSRGNPGTGDAWATYMTGASATAGAYLLLEKTSAVGTSSVVFNGTNPTSSVFSIGNWAGTNSNGLTYIAYCFAPVSGFSAFGSYTGNGLFENGPFVYTGFRPRFLLVKRVDASPHSWFILDSARSTYNDTADYLIPNATSIEADNGRFVDFLSNGFKVRDDGGSTNAGTIVYAAFAESPFQYSRAR